MACNLSDFILSLQWTALMDNREDETTLANVKEAPDAFDAEFDPSEQSGGFNLQNALLSDLALFFYKFIPLKHDVHDFFLR
tara:strand:+ start:494 stop:736 length:243 start_codon:yes stop_codon:yes gene_type:complete